MNWLGTIAREIYGLFVDDGRFAISLVGWVAVGWLALPRLNLASFWPPLLLFLGLAAILAESVIRRSRR